MRDEAGDKVGDEAGGEVGDDVGGDVGDDVEGDVRGECVGSNYDSLIVRTVAFPSKLPIGLGGHGPLRIQCPMST